MGNQESTRGKDEDDTFTMTSRIDLMGEIHMESYLSLQDVVRRGIQYNRLDLIQSYLTKISDLGQTLVRAHLFQEHSVDTYHEASKHICREFDKLQGAFTDDLSTTEAPTSVTSTPTPTSTGTTNILTEYQLTDFPQLRQRRTG